MSSAGAWPVWHWPSHVTMSVTAQDLEHVLAYSPWDPVGGDVVVRDTAQPSGRSPLTELPFAELADERKPSPRRQRFIEGGLGDTSMLSVRQAHLRFPAIAHAARVLEERFGAPVDAELHYLGRVAESDLETAVRPSDLHLVHVLEGGPLVLTRQGRDGRGAAGERNLAVGQASCFRATGKLGMRAQGEGATLAVLFCIRRVRVLDVVDAALSRSARQCALLRAPVFGGELAEIAPQYAGLSAGDGPWPELSWHGGRNELADRFFRELAPLPDGGMAPDASAQHVGLDSWVRHRAGLFFSLGQDERVALLRYPGGQLRLRAEALPVLRFIAETPRFRPRDLPDLLEFEARRELTLRLIRDGVLRCEG